MLGVQDDNGRIDDDENLDAHYLQSLSTDAIPALIQAQQNPQLKEADREELSAILACQMIVMTDEVQPDNLAVLPFLRCTRLAAADRKQG